MKAWFNGALCQADAIIVSAADRGLLLGDGLFETILARNRKPLRLDRHLARLVDGAGVIGLAIPPVDLAGAVMETLAANDLVDASLRLTVTRGVGPRGVLPPSPCCPTMLITAAPLAPPPSPAFCIVARTTRRNEHSPLSSIKSLNYLDGILARQEAQRAGADDAILLNTAGFVAEATAANLFVVRNGEILTPPVREGALPGITRETSLSIDDLMAADVLFMSGSLSLRAIARLNDRLLPGAGEEVIAELASRLAIPSVFHP